MRTRYPRRGNERSLTHPLARHCLHDRWQLSLSPDGEPSPGIVVQGDRVRTNLRGVNTDANRPTANLRIIMETNDHIHVERAIGCLQFADALVAPLAVVLYKYRQPILVSGMGIRVSTVIEASTFVEGM